MLDIPIMKLDENLDDSFIPKRMRAGDAALDIRSNEDVVIKSWKRYAVGTGLAIGLPVNTCGLLLPRSGLAIKNGITLLNSPGLIDSGYRGEIKIILLNTADEDFKILKGDRIAQLFITNVEDLRFVSVDDLPEAVDSRGSEGFGSSGTC